MSSALQPEIWNRVLGRFKGQPCRALEIGSYAGASAAWFSEHILTHADSSLLCIDPWEDVEPYKGRGVDMDNVRQTFLNVTRPFRNIGSRRATSWVMRDMVVDQFDWIYIDGSHHEADVLRDAVFAWQILKVGGIILFDDYEYKDGHGRPKVAIDGFMACMEGHYALIEKSYQVAIERLK